jgi:hypothetical protein
VAKIMRRRPAGGCQPRKWSSWGPNFAGAIVYASFSTGVPARDLEPSTRDFAARCFVTELDRIAFAQVDGHNTLGSCECGRERHG